MAGTGGPKRDLLTRVARTAERLTVYGQFATRSGLAANTRWGGLRALAARRRSGGFGPAFLFRLHAGNHPEKLAIVSSEGALDYRTLDSRIDALAAGLREIGVRRGDGATLVLRNRAEFVEAQTALSRLGAHAISGSHRATPRELRYLVEHSGSKVLFLDGALTSLVEEARAWKAEAPGRSVIAVGDDVAGLVPYARLLAAPSAAFVDDPDGGAVVIYTSGTTGKPKGAVRKFTEEAAVASLRFLLEVPIAADDRHLAMAPLYHSTAWAFVSFTFAVGGTVFLEKEFDPERFLALVERERITTSALVPTMLHRILALPESVRRRYDASSLRAIFSGGSPLPGDLARRFIEAYGKVLWNFYGATETGINTVASPDELLRSPGTIGHVVPGNELRIVDDHGHEVPTGETGELFVRNAMLIEGYHRDEAATRASMRDGFFSVGDLAHRDEHGLYHLDGRKRDMIISGGVNVYPAEVEEALHRHPAIADAAVIGAPDEEWGERVTAFVVLRRGESANEETIVAWAKRELSGAKVPRRIVFVEELPRNPTGKVLKRELRERSAD